MRTIVRIEETKVFTFSLSFLTNLITIGNFKATLRYIPKLLSGMFWATHQRQIFQI